MDDGLEKTSYEWAVEKRELRLIKEFQRNCMELALSRRKTLMYFPNPYGANYMPASRRLYNTSAGLSTPGQMCRDVRLQDQPGIPIMVANAA